MARRAIAAEGLSARTYVVCPAAEPLRVVAYYAVSTAMEQRLALPSAKLRRGMPDSIPLLLIGRLACDQTWQSLRLGGALLADALRRCLKASEIAGVRAVAVHALDEDAAAFYRHHGFIDSPLGERVLIMPIETVTALFTLD